MAVTAEMEGQRIHVRWPFGDDFQKHLEGIRTIPGRQFVKTPDKHWTLPLDMTVCRAMRRAFGDALVVGPNLRSWAVQAKRNEESLGKLALADSGTLSRLPALLPGLARAIHLGPAGRFMTEQEAAEALLKAGSYQAADVQFGTAARAYLNALQQGLGKTPETIATIWESGCEQGAHLVIAPKPAVDGTWEPELEMWQADAKPGEVEIFSCTGTATQRKETLARFSRSRARVRWVIVNPQMIQYRKTEELTKIARKAKPKEYEAACHCPRLKEPHWHYEPAFPEIAETTWRNIIIDECHKGNIRNHRSLTSFSINDLKCAPDSKRIAMSGTPMKKMGVDIWGILHWLRPDVFTSFWRFAEMFFEIIDNGYGKKVGRLLEDREQEFFEYLKPYVIRRTKDECLPWLPPKQFIEVPVFLSGKQLKQYQDMEKQGVSGEGEDTIAATNVLAEFTRLSQFANAYCKVEGGRVLPTRESAKLEALFQKLEEAGIVERDGKGKLTAGEATEQTVIFSQFKEMIYLVRDMLVEAGVNVELITGDQNKQGQRRQIKEAFQAGQIKVLCIVTTAGGVSLTLDAADSAHFIDESWDPGEDEQAEDRIHRASRNHQVRIYRYRAIGTVDEYKDEVSTAKGDSHGHILDVRRKLLKDRAAKAAA